VVRAGEGSLDEADDGWRLCTGTYLEEVEEAAEVDSEEVRGMAMGLDIASRVWFYPVSGICVAELKGVTRCGLGENMGMQRMLLIGRVHGRHCGR
jgi:hypothetical protein